MNDSDITGGNLHDLWKVAHMALPKAENAYNALTRKHADKLADGDTATFGRAFPAWQLLQQINQLILLRTAQSITGARLAINVAVAEFSLVDGDASKGVTAAGKKLHDLINDPNETDPDLVVEPKGDAVGPDFGDE